MIIRVSDLDAEGLRVDDVAAVPSPYSDRAWRLDGLDLLVERDAVDVFIRGHLLATVPQVCGRCLENFPVRVRADVDLRFVPRPATGDAVELGANDLDLCFYVADQIDLETVIESETTLALPMKPLCREDCRGLCPSCGVNRNLTACGCDTRPPDPRLSVLKDLAARLSH
jgi:DUF177 domain-containing protein